MSTDQKSGHWWARSSVSESFARVQSKLQSISSAGSSARSSASMPTYRILSKIQFLEGHWTEDFSASLAVLQRLSLVPCHVDLSIKKIVKWHLGFIVVNKQERKKVVFETEARICLSHNLRSHIISLYYVPVIREKSQHLACHLGRWLRSQGSLGNILEVTYDRFIFYKYTSMWSNRNF